MANRSLDQAGDTTDTDYIFLGTAPATPKDVRRGLVIGLLLLTAFVITVPSANRPVIKLLGFVPIYDGILIFFDLVTSALLFAQFRQLRERSLLMLCCGYIFEAPLVAVHALSFPDAFISGSLIGGQQTTALLWMGWHGLFPCFVIGYAYYRKKETRYPGHFVTNQRTTTLAIATTLLLAAFIILLTTKGEHLLPALMNGSIYKSTNTTIILSLGWIIHVIAIILLFTHTRFRRIIDVWLTVTMAALVIDLALSAIFVTGRYQLGFYLGRVYGLIAACIMLMILLREASDLYFHALSAIRQRRQTEDAMRTVEKRYLQRLEKEVHQRTQELKESKDLLQATNDSSIDMIQVFKAVRNSEGDIVDFVWILNNKTSDKYYGDVIGKSLLTMNPGVEKAGIFDTFKKVVETGEPDQSERHYEYEQFNGWFYQSTVKLNDGVATTTTDITARKQVELENNRLKEAVEKAKVEQALKLSEERFRIALSSANMAAWDWDIPSDVVIWNEQHYYLLGLEPDNKPQKAATFFALVHPEDVFTVSESLRHATEVTGIFRAEFRIIRKDRQTVWMSGYGRVVLYDDDGKAVRMVGVMYDITEHKRREKLRDEFIGVASHELKTPVTSMKAYAELVQVKLQETGDSEDEELLSKVIAQIDRLTGLINYLLDTTKISEGLLQLNPEEININELIKERLEEIRRTADHNFEVNLQQTIPVIADRERIGQVITNLLSNAIKYSARGTTITIHSHTKDKHINVSITDEGYGIPEQDQPKVFDKFYRVTENQMDTFPGLGLGLYISAQIISRHEGILNVKSKPGTGSTFSFTLPSTGKLPVL